MPTAATRLTKDSSLDAIKAAISETIAQLVSEGREQSQAVAIAYSQAERATGKRLGKKSKGRDLGKAELVNREAQKY